MVKKKIGDTIRREIQYSTIDSDGVLASYDIYHEQKGHNKPQISNAFQTLQVYSAEQLKHMLNQNGFKIVQQCNIDGTEFCRKTSPRIMNIAIKQ